jgi:putative acetyltransferase
VIDIARESPDQLEIGALLARADARSSSLYPAESRHGLTIAALLEAQTRFFVARQKVRAVGCGGYIVLPAQSAELKRLFVDPAARGRGVGRAIVMAAERAAVEEGVETLWLETGVKSIEALSLYRGLGFQECGPFGSYRHDALSVFMVKRLCPGEAAEAGDERHVRD